MEDFKWWRHHTDAAMQSAHVIEFQLRQHVQQVSRIYTGFISKYLVFGEIIGFNGYDNTKMLYTHNLSYFLDVDPRFEVVGQGQTQVTQLGGKHLKQVTVTTSYESEVFAEKAFTFQPLVEVFQNILQRSFIIYHILLIISEQIFQIGRVNG